jgi:hypothetical protein
MMPNKLLCKRLYHKIFTQSITKRLGVFAEFHYILSGTNMGIEWQSLTEKQYLRAAKELIWQWFFPQQTFTYVADMKEKRRYQRGEKPAGFLT